MKTSTTRFALLLAAAAIFGMVGVKHTLSAQESLTIALPGSIPRIDHSFKRQPLVFEPNLGQTDAEVEFVTRGPGYQLFLTATEAVMVLRMRLVGANDSPPIHGDVELPGKVNYFIGNDPSRWRTNISTFAKVQYRDVYPGTDLVYYAKQKGRLEYDFVLAPGADPDLIALEFDGADRMELDASGDLVAWVGGRPVRWQTTACTLQTGRAVGSTPIVRPHPSAGAVQCEKSQGVRGTASPISPTNSPIEPDSFSDSDAGDPGSLQCERQLHGHSDLITFVLFTPDGKRIMSTAVDQTLRIWDLHSGRSLSSWKLHGDGFVFALSADGKRVALRVSQGVGAGMDAPTFELWDVESGHQLLSYRGFMERASVTDLARVAWEGSHGVPEVYPTRLRIFLVTWDHPRPDQEIVSFQFVSKRTPAAPFLLAVTAE